MKQTQLFLASIISLLILSCSHTASRHQPGLGEMRPTLRKPELGTDNGTVTKGHVGHVFENGVSYVPKLPLVQPGGVEVFKVFGSEFDTVYLYKEGRWSFHCDADLPKDSEIPDNTLGDGVAAKWRDRARQSAGAIKPKSSPQPSAKPQEKQKDYTIETKLSSSGEPATRQATVSHKRTDVAKAKPVPKPQTRTVATRGTQPTGKKTAKVAKHKAKSVPAAKESQDEKAKRENLSRLLDHKTEENQADIAASRGEPAPQIPVVDIEVEND